MRKNLNRCAILVALTLYHHVGFANDLSQYFGGGLLQPARFYTTSQTVTIPVSGMYRISLVGAGGSGGCAKGSGVASGGGGGGFVEDDVYISGGTIITIILGIGGGAVSCYSNANYPTSSVQSSAGNVGGTSTISWGNIILTAYGGGAGSGAESNFNNFAGGAGGGASGGTNNQTGGAGGGASNNSNGTGNAAGGGGASASPYGPGGAGGAAASTGTSGNCASGGGGSMYGYTGASASVAGAGAVAGGGAGQGGAGTNLSTVGVNMLGFNNGESVDGVTRASGFDSLFDPWRALTGAVGSSGTTVSIATAGAFGAGQGGVAAGANVSNTGAVYFGGSGGASTYNGSFSASSSTVAFGGGSGGAAGDNSASSGNGGNAIASIERIK